MLSPGENQNQFLSENSNNPVEIAKAIRDYAPEDSLQTIEPLDRIIAQEIGYKAINKESYQKFGDRNFENRSIALQYFAPKGKGIGIDILAQNVEIEFYGDYDAQDPRVSTDQIKHCFLPILEFFVAYCLENILNHQEI